MPGHDRVSARHKALVQRRVTTAFAPPTAGSPVEGQVLRLRLELVERLDLHAGAAVQRSQARRAVFARVHSRKDVVRIDASPPVELQRKPCCVKPIIPRRALFVAATRPKPGFVSRASARALISTGTRR